MGNTWTTVETSKSPSGIAEIKVSTSGERVRITFEDGTIDKKFDRDDLPDVPKRLKDGKYFVALNSDKDEVISIRPANTKVPLNARCVDFVRPEEGADPEPKRYENKEKHYEYYAFTALIEIQDGMFKGVQVPKFLHYKFTDDGTGMVGFKGNASKSPRLRDLMEFCEVTGATDEQLEWPEEGNVLPDLLALIKSKKRDFQIIMKNGYIETLLSGDDYEEDDFVEDDEEDAPVKATKKTEKQNLKELGFDEDDELGKVGVAVTSKKRAQITDEDDVDEDFPPESKKVKRLAKVDEDIEDDEL